MNVIRVAGGCLNGDCDCKQKDSLNEEIAGYPPFHDGCQCYCVEIFDHPKYKQAKPDNDNTR